MMLCNKIICLTSTPTPTLYTREHIEVTWPYLLFITLTLIYSLPHQLLFWKKYTLVFFFLPIFTFFLFFLPSHSLPQPHLHFSLLPSFLSLAHPSISFYNSNTANNNKKKKIKHLKINRCNRDHSDMHTQFLCYLLIRDLSRSFILDDDSSGFVSYLVQLLSIESITSIKLIELEEHTYTHIHTCNFN